jgi:hypothetical protein
MQKYNNIEMFEEEIEEESDKDYNFDDPDDEEDDEDNDPNVRNGPKWKSQQISAPYLMELFDIPPEFEQAFIDSIELAQKKCSNIEDLKEARDKKDMELVFKLILSHCFRQWMPDALATMNYAAKRQSNGRVQYNMNEFCLFLSQLCQLMFYNISASTLFKYPQRYAAPVLPQTKFQEMWNAFHPYDEDFYSYSQGYGSASAAENHNHWRSSKHAYASMRTMVNKTQAIVMIKLVGP